MNPDTFQSLERDAQAAFDAAVRLHQSNAPEAEKAEAWTKLAVTYMDGLVQGAKLCGTIAHLLELAEGHRAQLPSD